ncbi:LysR family transcriptional regulator [Enterobacter ludwigii]|uniref:LysR family transcriptional regulator n=1 Tax=Enterobacter ludwigii TaxID=299767 RepID=UPI00159C4F19|nr:LysR family transcriptional regulator [Enterobacter ludwigii]QLA06293.1 LysR family transcriptional regulator [Enterobacter ludwigii]
MKYNFKKSELDAIIELQTYKNYGLAAKKLHIAQANLSRTISTIEERIGLKIFERDTRPIKTTKFGDELIPFIKKNLDALEELSSFAENYKQSLTQCINICAPSGILLFLAKHVLPRIKLIRPELNIRLSTYNIGTIVNTAGIVVRDDADITFTYSSPTNEFLVAKKVSTMRLDVYCSKENLLKHPISDVSDYERYPCVLLIENGNASNRWVLLNHDNQTETEVTVSGNYVVDNFMTGVEIARETDHFVFAPKILINEMQALNLVPTLPKNYEAVGNVYMVYKQKNYQPYRISVVTDLIADVIGNIFQFEGD